MPKPCPREIREDVVRVARGREAGSRLADVAADFGISEACLSNWMKAADVADGLKHGTTAADNAEQREAKKRIRLLEVTYTVGIYATRNVCAIVAEEERAEAIWVSGMSTGYSGNLGFRMPANWMYNQIKEIPSPSLDRNAVSVRANPLSSTQPVPLINGAWDPLHCGAKPPLPQLETLGLMKLQVLAEKGGRWI